MPSYTINLRSENPALLVDFTLRPGTHATIGASSNAEITLPLAGLADFACMIGRAQDGRVYLSDPDGSNFRFVDLPTFLSLSPYQFVVFQAVNHLEIITAPLGVIEPIKAPRRRILTVVAAAVLGLLISSLIAWDVSKKSRNLATKPKAQVIEKSSPESTVEDVSKIEPSAMPMPEVSKPVEETLVPEQKLNLVALAERIAPTVFRLEVKDADGNLAGTGTAFAISSDGLAVTNYHVVEKGVTYSARTVQGAEFAVSGVVAVDRDSDLAIVALRANNLRYLELGASEAVKIGAAIAVFGSPQGLSGTLSEGILSARRTEDELTRDSKVKGGKRLQITAPISSGSSGSPVIDQTGKVIGVVAAAFTGKSVQNLNFVIPVEAVHKLR